MLKRMKVEGVFIDPSNKNPVVMLREEEGHRRVPIWIGAFEAMAILLGLESEVASPRPISHDLMAALVAELGGHIDRVDVSEVKDGVYYANMHITDSEQHTRTMDCRPSDAIALAVRFDAPVFADEEVILSAGSGHTVERVHDDETDEEYWKRYLEGLDSEAFGKYKM